MKLGIDARPVQAEKLAGIGVYTHEIISNLSDEEVHLFFRSKENTGWYTKSFINHTLKFPSYRWKFEQIWETSALPYLSNKTKVDVFWGPRFYVPPKLKCKSVSTIHDIAYAIVPNIVNAKQADYFNRLINYSVENANHFITVSETTKNDFCSFFKVSPEKVHVIYNGYSTFYKEKPAETYVQSVLKDKNIPEKFILFLGTLEPRKNLINLVKAYIKSEAYRDEIPLVLSGKLGWLNEELMKIVNPLIEEKKVILTGFLSNEELRVLYHSCNFFAFPSLYEGFGIPVLEAMSAGAPVLTSNNSALKEIFSDDAVLTEATSVDSIVEGINKLMNNNLRNELSQKGKVLSEKFSWEKCAEEHKALFHKLAQS